MPKVSVIIPCFNVEKYIDRCIESVINQSMDIKDMEIICVDDCSTDNTVSHLKEWEAKYSDNFMLVCCEKNGRQGTARNIGMIYASADYIAFIDSDDWVEPEYIELMYEEAVRYELDVVCCQIERDSSVELSYFEDKGSSEKKLFIVDRDDKRKELIMHQTFGGACCKIIKKSFLEENNIRYPEGLAYEDLFFREIMHVYVNRDMLIERKMYHYFVNAESTTLGMNATYHTDYFTVVIQLWNYLESRGLVKDYKQEIEYEFMIIAGLQILKVLILRYSEPQYSSFLLLQTIIRQRIKNPFANKYINNNYFSESQLLCVNALYMDMSKSEYTEFADKLKLIGI